MILNIKLGLGLATLLTPISARAWTGFNYGAFWGYEGNVKYMEDFRDSFNYAKNLTATIPFDSARIFTCKTQGTKDTYTGAFDAAVQTKTHLLLGFWISPAKEGDPIDALINDELSALEHGFLKHGQALADLVIGLSVGSEDIHRFEDDLQAVGVSRNDVSVAITKVKEAMGSSRFDRYMKGKPVGHVDTAKHVVVEGADFYGMTAYPYWNHDPIDQAKLSFLGSLEDVKQRAGKIPVWIAEMGWPYQGVQRGQAVASADNLQRFWDEVGCSTVGMYPTFWFELLKDSSPDQPDWAILDSVTKQPRIKNFTCDAGPYWMSPTSPASLPPVSSTQAPFQDNTIASLTAQPLAIAPSTVYVETTITITVQPTPLPEEQTTTVKITSTTKLTTTAYYNSLPIVSEPQDITKLHLEHKHASSAVPWCVTVADVDGDGQLLPVDGNPAGPDGKCTSPPAYTELPYARASPTVPYSIATTQDNVAASSSSALVGSSSTVSQAAQPPTSAIQMPVQFTSQASATTMAIPSSVGSSSVKSACTPKILRTSSPIFSSDHTNRSSSNGTLLSTLSASKNPPGGLTGFTWPPTKPTSQNETNHV